MSATLVELGKVAQFINGAAFKPEDWGDEGKKIIRIQNLTDQSKPYNKTLRQVDSKLVVERGDLLVSWSATLGVFEWADEDALLNQHIFRVVPDLHRVDKNYLKHSLKNAITEMDKHLHGATMKHINRGEFLATKIPLPPLAEQRRIAEILDKANEIKAKREFALAKLDELAQSTFVAMFENPEVLKSKNTLKLIDAVDFSTGYAFKSVDYVEKGEETIRLCRGANVMPNTIDWSDTVFFPYSMAKQHSEFQLNIGDIVIAMDRPWISSGFKIAQIETQDIPSLLVQRVARIRAKNTEWNNYLYYLLKHKSFTNYCKPTETTVPHISPIEIKDFQFSKPDALKLKKFNSLIQIIKSSKIRFERSFNFSMSLYSSLQHQAFTTGFNA